MNSDSPSGGQTSLLVLGVACLIAAIIGGGLKAFGFEFRPIDSLPRQILLADLGLVLVLWSQDVRPRIFLTLQAPSTRTAATTTRRTGPPPQHRSRRFTRRSLTPRVSGTSKPAIPRGFAHQAPVYLGAPLRPRTRS